MFAGGIILQEGTVRFNNNNDAGPKSLRLNSVTFGPTVGEGTLSLGGSGNSNGEGSELRTGEWSSATLGAGTIVAATTVTDSAIGASGHDLLVLALADANFSGTVSNLATSGGGVLGPNSSNGNLDVRGIATQTLSGTTNINETISVFSGAGLALAGSAAMIGDRVNLNLNGGSFTLDNSEIGLADRFFDAGSVETRGGGTLTFVGNPLGSSETLGRIQMGTDFTTPPNARSGALNVRLIHHAVNSAATVLTFAGIQRDSGRATIDFAASDGYTTLELGAAGNAPRVLLTAAPSLSSSGLFDSPLGTGWATVGGSDFATYDAATGVKAVDTVPFSSAAASDNALVTTSQTIGGLANKTIGSLKISPSAGQTLDLQGSGHLVSPALLLAGPHAFEIRNTQGGTGGLAIVSTQHVFVEQADLSIGVPITGGGALVKSGRGTLILEGANTYTGPTTINEGQVRATPGASLGPGVLELRGGVLEIAGGGTFNRHLDYGVAAETGRINWTAVTGLPAPSLSKHDRGSGGFAAVGAEARVDLNGLGPSDIVWEDPAFLASGYVLIRGSPNADSRVELIDNIGLGISPKAYHAREIRVTDNPDSDTDQARLSGIVFSDSAANNGVLTDLLKTGDGVLELSGNNTYIGGGGTLSPGTSVGILTTHDIVFEPGSLFSAELNGNGAGVGYDQLNVYGSVTLGGATLALSLGYVPNRGDTFVIVENDLADPIGGRFANYPDGFRFELDGYPLTIDYQGGDGNDVALTIADTGAWVSGRHIFYDNCVFDGNRPGAGIEDDFAIAPDKKALRPNETATFDNYTNYSRGINGIMIDIEYLPGNVVPDRDNFVLKVGNDDNPANWNDAPEPVITVRPLDNTDTTRITISWDDDAIRSEWLQVTVLADELELARDDVFYFGNAVAEAGDQAINAIVNATDEIVARNFQHGIFNAAAIEDPYDYNRDGLVDGTDQILARNHQTNPLTALRLITAPGEFSGPKHSAAPVPEPSTLVMLITALIGSLLALRRLHGQTSRCHQGLGRGDGSRRRPPKELRRAGHWE